MIRRLRGTYGDGVLPGLAPLGHADYPVAASLIASTFPWRSPMLGAAYAWLSLCRSKHWMNATRTAVVGMRPCPARTTRRLFGAVEHHHPVVLLFDFCVDPSPATGVATALVAARSVLREADRSGAALAVRVQSGNSRITTAYYALGFERAPCDAGHGAYTWLIRSFRCRGT